ncbi:MAG: cell wall hydrolase [Bacillota bacterium]
MRRAVLILALAALLMFSMAPGALAAVTYTVQPHESLYLIGLKHGVGPQKIIDVNNLTSDMIYPGQKLILPSTLDNGVRYITQPGDTLFLIGMRHGVNAQEIAQSSKITGTMIYPGQKLVIPDHDDAVATGSGSTLASRSGSTTSRLTASASDIELLSRIIYGEARGEPYNGQVAVAAVALNRLKAQGFPKTLYDVIHQPWAFTSINDGQFFLPPDAASRRAALDAINGVDPSGGALYFWNPEKSTSKWIWTRKVIATIGNHLFGI